MKLDGFLCFIDRVSLYNLVNKTNLVQNFSYYVDKKNQLDVTFCILYFSSNSCVHGRTTCQPDLATFPQPRHIPTRGYNITQSSAPDDGHMVARNMLSNYYKRNKEYKKWHLVGFSYPHWITMHGEPHIRKFNVMVRHKRTKQCVKYIHLSQNITLLNAAYKNMYMKQTILWPSAFHDLSLLTPVSDISLVLLLI